MSPEHIAKIIALYITRLDNAGIIAKRMETSQTFQSLSTEEILMHARHLCNNVETYLWRENELHCWDPAKAARHLAALQMCLSFAGWYTLDELMDHNRSHS